MGLCDLMDLFVRVTRLLYIVSEFIILNTINRHLLSQTLLCDFVSEHILLDLGTPRGGPGGGNFCLGVLYSTSTVARPTTEYLSEIM